MYAVGITKINGGKKDSISTPTKSKVQNMLNRKKTNV
jgi:hypothetical protein